MTERATGTERFERVVLGSLSKATHLTAGQPWIYRALVLVGAYGGLRWGVP